MRWVIVLMLSEEAGIFGVGVGVVGELVAFSSRGSRPRALVARMTSMAAHSDRPAPQRCGSGACSPHDTPAL